MLALDFAGGAVTDKVNHGQAASLDDLVSGGVFTIIALVNPVSFVTNTPVLSTAGIEHRILWMPGGDGKIGFLIDRVTTNSNFSSTVATGYSTGSWQWVMGAFDDAGIGGQEARIYRAGDVHQPLSEVAYNDTTEGDGGITTDIGTDKIVGNYDGADFSWDGRIALVAAWKRVLTLDEADAWILGRHLAQADQVLNVHYGYGAGAVDYSGQGNDGTITGATVGDGPPVAGWQKRRAMVFVPAAAVQFLRPDSDLANPDAWQDEGGGTVDIYTSIDEAVADDADWIQGP